MKIRWWWILFLVPIIIGIARLRFDAEVLDLLPPEVPAVQGLKLYQQHFSDSRQLIITVKAADAESAGAAARSIADRLRAATNLVADVTWQPPWQEHPEQTAELVAALWLNQPPDRFEELARRLSPTNLPDVLAAARERLATTMSPDEIGRLSYDPLGLTRLPQHSATPDFARGQNLFSSADGTFRIVFVRAQSSLADYRECIGWLHAVKDEVGKVLPPDAKVALGYTGRPVFVAEISSGMKHDIHFSVLGTALIIAVLFWLAHRRIKPMLWLLTLLALILGTTLALGGLVFGTINVMSMGFAAILLGLAVDYAVVHYQEALAHPDWTIPQVRRAIAPAIFWAAVTTISAFLILNFGGLPGLAQLGSFVGIGVALAALLMIFAYLPPLFPQRMRPVATASGQKTSGHEAAIIPAPDRSRLVFAITAVVVLVCVGILCGGLPGMDTSGSALQPRNSEAYTTLNAIKTNLDQSREPLWLVIAGDDETAVARKLDVLEPLLAGAVSNHTLVAFDSPGAIWPRPEFQDRNRAVAAQMVAEHDAMRSAVLSNGFSENAFGLADGVLQTWQRALDSTNVFWPTNPLCEWIFRKVTARETNQLYAAAFLFPAPNADLTTFESTLPRDGVWLSGWELLGGTVLAKVKHNLWKLLVPMAALILLSLWLAFRRFTEIVFSFSILVLSGLCLLAVMRLCGWHWNLLNLMALPLILGTGVDYSIFMQLALRRYGGDLRRAHQAVGRALLLCGGTAIAGFGSLGFSSNAGMAGFGRVCAVGITGNMLISIFLLPTWWKYRVGKSVLPGSPVTPSRLYAAGVWKLGLIIVRIFPQAVLYAAAKVFAAIYWRTAGRRREIVVRNLLPVFANDRARAETAGRELLRQFAIKICELLRFESGINEKNWFTGWKGWDHFNAAHARGKGVLLVTPHLGNWEFGGAFLVENGYKLLILTQPEPDERLTALRRDSRAQRGVETLVVGDHDAFAFVEIIKRLQAGAVVALLVDRPPAHTAVNVKLFGKDFPASIAAAELARASGCAILPCSIVRGERSYRAEILPEIVYDRAAIGSREGRIGLTQQILRALEPVIRENAAQWYHFVPVWPGEK